LGSISSPHFIPNKEPIYPGPLFQDAPRKNREQPKRLVFSFFDLMDLHLSDVSGPTRLEKHETLLVDWLVGVGKFSLVGTHEHMVLLVAKILHQLVGSLSHYLQGFIHPRWCRISSINSIYLPRHCLGPPAEICYSKTTKI